MNIKELNYYHDLVLTKNFSLVAQHFNVSQPTVTMAIKRLEEKYNATFFIRDRSHNTLSVTAIGRQFDQHVKSILEELTVAEKEITRAKQESISFGLPPIIGNYYFPAFTPALLESGLLYRLEVVDHGSASLQHLLLNGDIDAALLGSLKPLNRKNLRSQVITRAPFKIIVSKSHPLAKQKRVKLEDAAKFPFIMLDDEYVHAEAFKQVARDARKRPRIIFKTSDVHILKTLVANNSGISFLTDIALEKGDELVSLPIEDPDQPEFIVSLVARGEHLTKPIEKLWNILSKSDE